MASTARAIIVTLSDLDVSVLPLNVFTARAFLHLVSDRKAKVAHKHPTFAIFAFDSFTDRSRWSSETFCAHPTFSTSQIAHSKRRPRLKESSILRRAVTLNRSLA